MKILGGGRVGIDVVYDYNSLKTKRELVKSYNIGLSRFKTNGEFPSIEKLKEELDGYLDGDDQCFSRFFSVLYFDRYAGELERMMDGTN